MEYGWNMINVLGGGVLIWFDVLRHLCSSCDIYSHDIFVVVMTFMVTTFM